jgi:hypothetical protein
MKLKYIIHRFLSDDEIRTWIEGEALGVSHPPSNEMELAWREGRRSLAVELIGIYREVENERNTRVGAGSA